MVRRRRDPIGPCPEINPVQIDGENLLLAETGLEPEGEKKLLHLAFQGSFGGQEQVLGKLLGKGAATLADGAGPQIGEGGPDDPDPVDPGMIEKSPVFGRDDGLHQIGRHLVELHRAAMQIAIIGEH